VDQDVPPSVGANEAAETFRRASLWLTALSIAVAAVMVTASGIRVDSTGMPPLTFLAAAFLVGARACRHRRRLSRIADCLGPLGLAWLGGLASAVVAIMGLHMHFPLADGALKAADRAFGFDGLAAINWLVTQPQWLMTAMSKAYFGTIPFLYLGMVVLALLGDRLEVWRAAFCFIGTVLTTCLISVITPAKGLGAWASPGLIARLPRQSIRHFWPSFEKFYDGANPVLQVDSIGGVVSFPSFHTIMGLIAVAMWRSRPFVFVPALAGLALMVAGTLPFGGHYAVDLAGGAAVWAAWFALSRRLEAASSDVTLAPLSRKLTAAGVS
jgi:membrane-associated phospholipid phosphatase